MFRKYLKQALLSEIVAVPLSDTFFKNYFKRNKFIR